MEIEKLLVQKKALEAEVREMQGEVNKIKLNILEKKNSESFVKIGHLNQSIEEYNKKINNYRNMHSEVAALKKVENDKSLELSSLKEKILEAEREINSFNQSISNTKIEIQNSEKVLEILIQQSEQEKASLRDLHSENLFSELETKKSLINELSSELSTLTANKLDPLFLYSKSEEQKDKLQQKLKELEEYYDPQLISEMENLIPHKIQERDAVVDRVARCQEEKAKIHEEILDYGAKIQAIDEDHYEKKQRIKELQESINELEDEIELLRIDNEKYEKLNNLFKKNTEHHIVDQGQLEKLEHTVEELKKTISTKESNYKNGIRSVTSRISQINSINNDLRNEINSLLGKINSNRS